MLPKNNGCEQREHADPNFSFSVLSTSRLREPKPRSCKHEFSVASDHLIKCLCISVERISHPNARNEKQLMAVTPSDVRGWEPAAPVIKQWSAVLIRSFIIAYPLGPVYSAVLRMQYMASSSPGSFG